LEVDVFFVKFNSLLIFLQALLPTSVAFAQTIIVSSNSLPSNGGTVSNPYYRTTEYSNNLTPNFWYDLYATPAVGYYFSGWSGDSNSTTNPLSFYPTSNFNITANFELLTYSVSSEIIGEGNTSGAGTYSYGSEVSLIANNLSTSTFLGWDTNNTAKTTWSSANQGYFLNQTNPLTVKILQDNYYKAYFSKNVYPPDGNLTQSLTDFIASYPYPIYFSGIPLTNNPKQLTEAHVEGITYFTAPNSGQVIKNLQGIQYAKNLQALSIQRNGISDLSPLLSLRSLTSLDLSGGGTISSIQGIDELSFLQYLYLDRHRVSSIAPLLKLPYLYHLKIKENFLDLSDPVIQYEISALRQYTTVEVQQQIPVPVQNLASSMKLVKEKLKIDSSDPTSNFIFALELILNLVEDDGSSSLKALALSLGANQDIASFSIPDMWLEDLHYGKQINPTFNFTEIESYLKETFIVTLEIAYLYLDRIPDTTSYLTLTQDFTGLEQVLYADMGDVYLLKSIINGLIGFSQIILSYDWPMTGLTAKQMHDKGMVNLETLFDSSSQFGSLKKNNLLSESRQNIKEAITLYKNASEYLRYRIAEKRFFNLDSSDLVKEEKFRNDLDDVMISLDYRIDLNNSDTQNDVVHLKNFFLGKVEISDAIPPPVGNNFESSQVQDPTFGGVLPFWTDKIVKEQMEQANLIANDAMEGVKEIKGAQNWLQSNWLGYFYVPDRTKKDKFWMYHLKLGWIYLSSSTPSDIWLFHQITNSWLWTKKSSFPYLYSQTEKTWYYLLETGQMLKWKQNSWNP
jgi:uncharacterized repeat protein (TIGR02543 family)